MNIDNNDKNSEEGNTKPLRIRNTKFCFTLNNYTTEEYDELILTIKNKNIKYIIGKEVGKQGTKHLQGFLLYKNSVSFNSVKKILPKAHIEIAKGNVKQNVKYCSKDNDFVTNFEDKFLGDERTHLEKTKEKILEKHYSDITFKKWQKDIIELLNKEPDYRSIYWYYDINGNVGKSWLVKYIFCVFDDVIIVDGKKDNIFNQIKSMIDREINPKIIILDVPRVNNKFINYSVIEQIKNGLIYSGKYEGGVCLFDNPHVIIFSNEEPEYDKLSQDRLKVIEIK